MIKELATILIGYFIGSFSIGYYLVSFYLEKDIRLEGSGGTGARNVGRLMGTKGFVITYVGDTLKGVIAVFLAMLLHVQTWAIMFTIIAVVVGHIYPFQLKFRGGKGASTAFGALLVFDYRISLILLVMSFLLTLVSKRTTLSGIIGIGTIPVILILLGHTTIVEVGSMTFLTILLLLAHRSNIQSILKEARKSKV